MTWWSRKSKPNTSASSYDAGGTDLPAGLRGYLVLMMSLLLYHVLGLAGLLGGVGKTRRDAGMTRQEERELELELQNPDDHRPSDEWDGPDRIGAGATSGGKPAPMPQPELSKAPDTDVKQERWNLFFQTTSIGQYHGTFRSPYEGPFSLQNTMERDASLTTTVFLGLRLENNTELYFNPEIAGGRGFSGVNGLANPSNGELPRVARPRQSPTWRVYTSSRISVSALRPSRSKAKPTSWAEAVRNALHDHRGPLLADGLLRQQPILARSPTQFMEWSVMYNGAWDYPADVRGYTWGWVHEFHTRNWSLRYGSAAKPRTRTARASIGASSSTAAISTSLSTRYKALGHAGTLRALHYENRTRSGSYGQALQIRPPQATRRTLPRSANQAR